MTDQDATRTPTIASDAPVVSAAELEIDAPVESVREILTEIERWPAWNPDVTSVSLDGSFAESSTFRWKAGPGTIRSVVEYVDRPLLVEWSGRTLGIRAVHVWRLEPQNGRTFVRTEESYGGLVAWAFRRPLRNGLDTALVDGVRHLKAEAERTTSASG